MRRAVAVLLVAAALTGCGKGNASSGSPTKLTVLAAASLTDAFPKIGAAFTKAHSSVRLTFSFAGTDQLAAQIQQGAPADVFAGASTNSRPGAWRGKLAGLQIRSSLFSTGIMSGRR